MFVCGTADGIIKVSGRRHNCDDLKATILAVDPIKFVYRGRLVSQKIICNNLQYYCHLSWTFTDTVCQFFIFMVFNFSVIHINRMFFFVDIGNIMVQCPVLLIKQLDSVNLF